MIRVRVRHAPPFRLEVKGHAGQAPAGQDLVCAAVSALMETLVLGLEDVSAPGRWSLDSGRFVYEGEPDERAALLLRTTLLGLRSLAGSHGRYISVEEV
jgi:uncharacterized protein YsxB (DUF464 family)